MAIVKLFYLIKGHILSLLGAVLLGFLGHITAVMIPVFGVILLFHDKAYGWVFIALGIMRALLRYSEQYLNHLVAFKILADIRAILFKKLRSLSPAIMDGEDRGNLVSMMISDVELLEVFYAHTISPLFIALLMMVFVGVISPYPMITIITQVLIGFLIPIALMKVTERLGDQYRDSFSDLNSLMYEYANYYDTLESFSYLDKMQLQMEEKSRRLSQINVRMAFLDGLKQFLNEFLMWGGAVLFLLVTKGSLDTAVIALAVHLSSFGPVLSLSALIQNLFHTLASANRVVALLDKEVITDKVLDGVDIESIESVKIDNVSFAYGEGPIVIEDYSLDVKVPEVISIEGRSGSGKSTLLKLLSRSVDVDKGSILINGVDIRNINTRSLRTKVSVMTQESVIFSKSILENVQMVAPHKSFEEVVEACKKASLHEFIVGLENGYDTLVEHRGSNLSSGEKQRLALARLFLHDGDLILLDEVTSNVDYLNERMIGKSIKELSKEKIVFIVSHKGLKV